MLRSLSASHSQSLIKQFASLNLSADVQYGDSNTSWIWLLQWGIEARGRRMMRQPDGITCGDDLIEGKRSRNGVLPNKKEYKRTCANNHQSGPGHCYVATGRTEFLLSKEKNEFCTIVWINQIKQDLIHTENSLDKKVNKEMDMYAYDGSIL